MSPTTIKLDPALKARLERLAAEKDRSADWLMSEAIRDFVTREEARAQFRQDAMDAWNDYKATGKCISEEAADAWLAKLEAGEDAEPPEES